MEHRLKRNTLTKIVVLYLSLFLVFGVLFISLYSSCYRILYRDTLSKSESRLNAGLEAFRDDLTRMMLLVNDYSATDEYLLLRAVNDPATVQNSLAMNKACEKLHSILDIENSYVKQVYSLFLNNNLFLSDRTSSMDYGQSFGILIRSKSGTLSAQDWKRSHFDSILPIRLLNGSDISSAYLPEDTNLLLCVVKTDNVTRKASDVVVFMIDADALMETLIDPDMLKSSTLRLTDGENALLCSSRGHVDPGEISLTIQATDSAFDLHAELTVPKSYFSNQLKSLTSIVRIYMFVGILGIFALLLVLIVRQYRPLSGLITLSARYGGEGDASNLYDYIGRTVQAVISAKNDADQRLAILHSAAKNTLLHNSLRFGCYTNQSKQELTELLGEIADGYLVAILHSDSASDSLLNDTDAFLRSRLDAQWISVPEDPSEEILLLRSEPESADGLLSILQALAAEMAEQAGGLQIGVSECACGVENLHKAYKQARLSLMSLENQADFSTMLAYRAEKKTSDMESVTPETLVKLNELILSGNEDALSAYFDAIEEELSKHPPIGIHFQHVFGALSITIQSAADLIDNPGVEISAFVMDEAPLSALERLRQLALHLCRTAAARRSRGNLARKQAIVDYLNRSYSDPSLCSDGVAEVFGIKRNQLYRILQETVGCSFAEYVEQVRMNAVEELLLNTDLSIDEIAERAGFGAVNTLYRVFKKHKGVPPATWRRENQAKQTK